MAQSHKVSVEIIRANRIEQTENVEKMLNELGYKEHHTSLARGYQTRKYDSFEEYEGRFGKGYIRRSNNRKSNRYHNVTYYIK